MTTELTLPRVGTNMEEATIMRWICAVGDRFSKGAPLYEIETDKVTYEVEATLDGQLLEIRVPAGENAMVGQVVGIVGE
jgi:pyruvate dehydrogenase E2 component (dihydrolipoamide acetyltransferase)